MTVEDIFRLKPSDDNDDTLVSQLATNLIKGLPLLEDGDVDWQKAGEILGERLQGFLDSVGVTTSDPNQATRVSVGSLVALCNALYRKRSQLLSRKQQRDLSILLGFADATGITEKLMLQLIKLGFRS